MTARVAILSLVAFAYAGTVAASQLSTVLVRVIDDRHLRPLPNAEVVILSSGERRLANDRGEVRLRWPDSGDLRIRVRQIGFKFAEHRLDRSMSRTDDAAIVRLAPVAYVLPRVVTTAKTACAPAADSASAILATAILEQLRLGAERYELFRRTYPFRLEIVKRTGRTTQGGLPRRVVENAGWSDSDKWREPYRLGRVVERSWWGFSVPILFVSTLADSVFWAHHCFYDPGVETRDGARVVRLAFSPTPDVRTPDWAGVAFLDSTTSVLRRVEFRLAGLRRYDRPRRLEGYITFKPASPFVIIPDTTVAVWWYGEPTHTNEWGVADVGQLLFVKRVEYRDREPPR